jgi:hypothetical protein
MSRDEYEIEHEPQEQYDNEYYLDEPDNGEQKLYQDNPYIFVDKVSEIKDLVMEYCHEQKVPLCKYLRNEDIYELLDY